MAKGGLPRGTVKDPPAEVTLGVPGRPGTAHVAHGGDPPSVGMDDPGPGSEGDHQHKRYRTAGYLVEGGGGADRHLPPCHPRDARRPPRVQDRKRYGDGYNRL